MLFLFAYGLVAAFTAGIVTAVTYGKYDTLNFKACVVVAIIAILWPFYLGEFLFKNYLWGKNL